MTDTELIAWLRQESGIQHGRGREYPALVIGEAADRLEVLTRALRLCCEDEHEGALLDTDQLVQSFIAEAEGAERA